MEGKNGTIKETNVMDVFDDLLVQEERSDFSFTVFVFESWLIRVERTTIVFIRSREAGVSEGCHAGEVAGYLEGFSFGWSKGWEIVTEARRKHCPRLITCNSVLIVLSLLRLNEYNGSYFFRSDFTKDMLLGPTISSYYQQLRILLRKATHGKCCICLCLCGLIVQ